MDNKHKRVLWLLNHTTLREFEVPLLRSLGYEVYTPKIFVMKDFSGSVDFQYDESLTIPKDALEELNNHDFYSQPINSSLRAILNKYFFAAIPGFFPTMIHELMENFKGQILMRMFGQLEVVTYSGLISNYTTPAFIKDMHKVGDRLWFAQSYTNLVDVESSFFKERAIFLPLGLPDSIYKNENKWVGGNHHVLFVCPRINAAPEYYGKIYRDFVRDFGDFPYIVAGGQPIPVADSKVAGFQPRHVFDEWLKTCKVMYYHSQEPRHLHYHPLEAVIVGMPLIYMRGGILEKLGGDYQPGACKTIAEAREKIKRVLNDDEAFIRDVCQAQKKLLETFSFEYCHKIWQENFVNRFNEDKALISKPRANKPQRKVVIFLPVAYRGGSLNAAKNMAKMLLTGSRDDHEPLTVIFSCVAGVYNVKEDFADLISAGIQIRETRWQRIATSDIVSLPFLRHASYDVSHEYHQFPVDNIANFEDCDFWLMLSDRTADPLLGVKPYGVIIYDYIQRYVPELFGSHFEGAFLSTTRRAKFVLTTTPQTRIDAIQYCGVRADNTYLLPMEFNIDIKESNDNAEEIEIPSDNYFIWATNCAQHKNHLVALEALQYYYEVLNGSFLVFITDPSGLFTKEQTNLKELYHQRVWEKLNKSEVLTKNAKMAGYLEQNHYFLAVSRAKFIWHPTKFDNGTFSVVEAAYYRVPALSSDYPQMRYINDRFNLNMQFCDANDAIKMAFELKHMEQMYQQRAAKLPDKSHLEQFSCHRLAPAVWQTMKELI